MKEVILMGMIELASHVIAKAQSSGSGVTNLQLQKVLYFTLLNAFKNGIITKEELTNIYDKNFLVWRYGPVVKEVYEKYNGYGASKIFSLEKQVDSYKKLDPFIDELLNKDPFALVRESHKHSHWKQNEDTINYGRGLVTYSMEDLISAAK